MPKLPGWREPTKSEIDKPEHSAEEYRERIAELEREREALAFCRVSSLVMQAALARTKQELAECRQQMKNFKAEGVPVVIRDLIVERLQSELERKNAALVKLMESFEAVVDAIKDSISLKISINNHKYDGVGAQAIEAIAVAKEALAEIETNEKENQ